MNEFGGDTGVDADVKDKKLFFVDFCSFEIEATSRREAEEIAMQKIANGDFPEVSNIELCDYEQCPICKKYSPDVLDDSPCWNCTQLKKEV